MSFSLDSQNNLENLIAKNRVKGFSIYLLVLIAILVLILSLPFIKVDISSQSRGVVRSQVENVPLMSMLSGKIVSLNLENNHNVAKGDTLVILTQDNLKSEQETTQNLSKETRDLLNDLRFLLQNKPQSLRTSTIRQEWQSYQTKLSELLSKEEQSSIVYNRNKQLYDKGVIALVDYEKTSYDYTYAKQAVASFQKNQYSLWQNRVQELTEKAENLRGTLDKIEVESQNYIITAPISGTIEGFSGVQVGSYLLASQPIASISPNHNLIVETMDITPNWIEDLKEDEVFIFGSNLASQYIGGAARLAVKLLLC